MKAELLGNQDITRRKPILSMSKQLKDDNLFFIFQVLSCIEVIAKYPPKFICAMLSLTDDQLNAALSYIETHRREVEAEYQLVLKEAKELQQYDEEQNRDLIARIAAKPPKIGMEVTWEKLQTQKAKHQAKQKRYEITLAKY